MKKWFFYIFMIILIAIFSYCFVCISEENKEYVFSLGKNYNEANSTTKEEKLFKDMVTLASNLSNEDKAVLVNLTSMKLYLINKAYVENEFEVISKGPDDK